MNPVTPILSGTVQSALSRWGRTDRSTEFYDRWTAEARSKELRDKLEQERIAEEARLEKMDLAANPLGAAEIAENYIVRRTYEPSPNGASAYEKESEQWTATVYELKRKWTPDMDEAVLEILIKKKDSPPLVDGYV